MLAQPLYNTTFDDSSMYEDTTYNGCSYMNDYLKQMAAHFPPPLPQQQHYIDTCSSQYQQNGVRIAQDESMLGLGGMESGYGIWGGENVMDEGPVQKSCNPYGYPAPQFQLSFSQSSAYSRPTLSLSTGFECQDAFIQQQNFISDSLSSGSYSDMGAYSSESSPYLSTPSLPPSMPHTPVTPSSTPLLPGQVYTAPGIPSAFVLVPVTACSPDGSYTTVFYPKQANLDQYMDEDCSMGIKTPELQPQMQYSPEVEYTMPSILRSQEESTMGYEETESEEMGYDGPELVGMGLYDEPPELLWSTSSSPELASGGSGRGLVLEQSFDPEEEEDEDEELDG